MLRILLLLAASLLLLSGCGIDADQDLLCRKLIPAFESDPITDARTRMDPEDRRIVRVDYQTGGVVHWIACRFAGTATEAGRTSLEAVATDRTGWLSPIRFAMLEQWVRIKPPRHDAAPAAEIVRSPPTAWTPWLFLLQQIVNAATVACVYGLLALGYTLVYAILGQINLAMGELTMVGAMLTAMAAAGLGMAGWASWPPALLGMLVLVMGFTAVQGWTMDRLVFRRLRRVRSHTPLIVAVGLSVAWQEGVRLLHGARDWWPTPVLADRHDLIGDGAFTVTALSSQLAILALTGGLYALLWGIMQRTPFGRAHRACTDDVAAAELMGVDVNRTVAVTFAIGGGLAAAAGAVIALYYGGVNFFTGYLIGFKALAAAVVGGIGSVPGAMLGGALLGLVETFWSAYFVIAYKDIVAFGLLTLFLIYRPQGLLGQARGRGD
ncbi:branched-chain amino acid transport system permease protein [Azospirillum agricola]|uniref:branched-chain amino acid ABC transporter permease n=1 Tax=Azospirillum agricola TaxID=1720247 RepID=UPI001AE4E3BC|nr:branched-chain amino acid ABC transporter permease [Azospirillum agricola]MBP2228139.1 branched-chain amino acid transport system permease protein [Azospirillum agricola]